LYGFHGNTIEKMYVSWLPYPKRFPTSELAYGQPLPEAPRNIRDQPVDR